MLNRVAKATVLIVAFLGSAAPPVSSCVASPEKGWVKFLDQTHGFCFWYPPTYKREAGTHNLDNLDASNDRQLLATLISNELRQAHADDEELADLRIYLLPGMFDLKRLVREAPTGYETPPRPGHYGANVFYYYGPGGGGVAYPDKYCFNLSGRALQLVFNGPYPGTSESPTTETQAIEKIILSSFKAAPR
jgi:hypothetical protein